MKRGMLKKMTTSDGAKAVEIAPTAIAKADVITHL